MTSLDITSVLIGGFIGSLFGLILHLILQANQLRYDKEKQVFDLYITKKQETYMALLDLFQKVGQKLRYNISPIDDDELVKFQDELLSFYMKSQIFQSKAVRDYSYSLLKDFDDMMKYYLEKDRKTIITEEGLLILKGGMDGKINKIIDQMTLELQGQNEPKRFWEF